jgi:hypothetical protein
LGTNRLKCFQSSTTFRFAAYRDLKRTLGQINAVVETAELAMRAFAAQARIAPSAGVFVKEMSAAHGVRVDSMDLLASARHMHHFYIMSVHQQLEVFLKALKKEHPRTTWLDHKENSLLKNVLSSFPEYQYSGMVDAVGRLEVDISDYYRNVRNALAHGDDKNSVSVAFKLRSKVQGSDSVYVKLAAPNTFDQTGFDDFILFTRAVKHIGLAFCSVARPTNSEIAVMLLDVPSPEQPQIDLARLEGKKRSPEALRSALGTLLRIRYGLDRHEAQPIVELLLSGPQALR